MRATGVLAVAALAISLLPGGAGAAGRAPDVPPAETRFAPDVPPAETRRAPDAPPAETRRAPDVLPAEARAVLGGPVAALRAAGESGSVAEALRATLRAGGRPEPRTGRRPPLRLDPQVQAALAPLPAALADPLGDLAAEVAAVTRAVEVATAGLDRGAVQGALAASSEVGLEPAVPSLGPVAPADTRQALRSTARQVRDLRAAAQAAVAAVDVEVDRDAIEAAAVRLAEAVDRAIPQLRRAAAQLPATDAPTAGCDLVDLLPFLCVGGTGPNHYTEDAALLVDLGGDDVHEHAAGGVNPVDASVGGPPVSVTVDLGGNDTYRHDVTVDRPQPGQGGAVIGIGMLVDVGGDDTYTIRAVPPAQPQEENLVTFARGQGAGALAGVGVLADLGGDDTYLVDTSGLPTSTSAEVQAQGHGIAGTGLLLDAGEGEDHYRVDVGTAGLADGPSGGGGPGGDGPVGARRSAGGQGTGGLAGQGVLIEGGGPGLMEMTGATEAPPEVTDYADYVFPGAPRVELRAHGMAAFDETVGFLVAGPGPTTYAVTASGTGLGRHALFAQGFGLGGGIGVLDDAGGDDRYVMRSEMTASTHVRTHEEDAEARLWGFSPTATQNVLGQGFAFHGLAGQPALGLLADHGGDDLYEARHLGEVEALAEATGAGAGAAATAVTFDLGLFWVQGSAVDSSIGVLLDAAGDDRYLAEIHHTVRADAVADDGSEHAVAYATPLGWGFVDAQGATSNLATGILADLGGTDRYEARAVSRAHASPTPGGAVEFGGMALFQGSGPRGLLVDVGDEPDTFLSEPGFPDTCVGHRGESPGWSECPPGRSERPQPLGDVYLPGGTGLVDGTPAKGVPAVTFAEDQSPAGGFGAALPVTGLLEGPDGAPLDDRVVEVRLQARVAGYLGGLDIEPTNWRVWVDVTAIHAVVGPDGTWRAVLRLPDRDWLPFEGDTFRLWAGFSGDEALRATGVALPFTLT